MSTKKLIQFYMRDKYLSHAAYYYFKAEGINETILSSINRFHAGTARQTLVDAGHNIPPSSEVYARAQTMFAPTKLHTFSEAQEAEK